MKKDPSALVRQSFQAYVDKDRASIESVLAQDFHFSSPLDNRIDRETYFKRCWPNSETTKDFKFIRVFQEDNQVVVTYVGENMDGSHFRNTEVFTISDNMISEVEVYFGWNVPHKAPAGGSVNS